MNFDLSIIDKMIIPVIVIFSLVVGYIMKKWIPADNKYIPTVLVVLGGILGGFISGWNIESITAGMLSALASTGLHQLFHQYLKLDERAIVYEVDQMGPGENLEDKITIEDNELEGI